MLATVRDAALAGADDMPSAIVSGLHDVFGVDYATYDEFGPNAVAQVAEPVAPAEIHAAFDRYAHEHPSLIHYRANGGPQTIRLSDVTTQRGLLRLGLWAHVFRPLGIKYQLNLSLHVAGPTLIGVGLSRTGRDFSDGERQIAELLRAELSRIVGRRKCPSPEAFEALGLTLREAEVLSLAGRRTSREVASVLGISERTVEKHLEHVYEKLGVSSRTGALAALE